MHNPLFRQDLPVVASSKNIVYSSWARSWILGLGKAEIYPQVLSRGRTFLRKGKVSSLELHPFLASACVDAQFECRVRFCLPDEILEQVPIKADLKALAGMKAKDQEVAFLNSMQKYFPDFAKLRSSCTCTEDLSFCTHAAAVLYATICIFDDSPHLMLQFLDMDLETHAHMIPTDSDHELSDEDVAAIFNL